MNKKKIGLSVGAAVVVAAIGWYFYAITFYSNPPLVPDFLVPEKPYMADTSDDTESADSDDEEYGADVVAVVNGEELLYDELETRARQTAMQQNMNLEEMDTIIRGQLYKQALATMVSHELLRQEAEDFGTTVDDAAVDEEFDNFVEQFGSEAALKEVLAEEGSTIEEFRSSLRTDQMINAYLDDQLALSYIEMSEEEVQAFYDELSEQKNLRPLEDAWDTFEQMAIEQEKQRQITAYVDRLYQEGDVEILF